MKSLKLEEWLRYGFSGGLLLVVLLLTHPNWKDGLVRANGIGGTANLLGVILLAGSLIYALHRAVAYRAMFTLAIFTLACFRVYEWDSKIFFPVVPSKVELKIDRWRLALRQAKNPLDSFIAEWGAQVHFLYCSVWAILLGITLASLFPNRQSAVSNWTYFWTSLVLAFGAFWHHLRLLSWINASLDESVFPAFLGHESHSMDASEKDM